MTVGIGRHCSPRYHGHRNYAEELTHLRITPSNINLDLIIALFYADSSCSPSQGCETKEGAMK